MKLHILIVQIAITLLMVFVFPIYFSYSTDFTVTHSTDSAATAPALHTPQKEQEYGK